MNRTRKQRNRDLIKRIMHTLATHPVNLPAVNDLGEQFIVTTLGEEPVSVLFDRVRAAGGYANVFIETRGATVLVPFIRTEGALDTTGATQLSMPVDADSTVDMLLDYLAHHPEGTVLSLAGPQHRPAIARPAKVFAHG